MAKKSKTRVPEDLAPFNQWLMGMFNMLSALVGISIPPVYMWQKLGLTSVDFAAIQAFYLRWWSGDPANPGLYEIHTNAYTVSKTIRVSRKNVVAFKKEFSVFIAPLLIRMDGSPNMTTALRSILNIADHNPPHKRHIDEILAFCFAKVFSTLGGIVRLKCSADSTASRASMLKGEGAIMIEVIYRIIGPTIDKDGNLVPPPPPSSSLDPTLIMKETSTKSSFFLTGVTAASIGKTLQGYIRWRDVHNPKRLGPLMPLPAVLIN